MINKDYVEYLKKVANESDNELSIPAAKALRFAEDINQLSMEDNLIAVGMFVDLLAEAHNVRAILVTLRDYLDKTEEEHAVMFNSPSDEMH